MTVNKSHFYLQGLLLDLLLLHICENHFYVIIALYVASSISYFATLVDFQWFPISLLYSLCCCNNLRIKEVLSYFRYYKQFSSTVWLHVKYVYVHLKLIIIRWN